MTYIGILFMKCAICLPSFAPNKFIHHILNPFGHQRFDLKFNNYVNFGQWPGLVTNKKSILPIINKYHTKIKSSPKCKNIQISFMNASVWHHQSINPMYCTSHFWITIPGTQCMVLDCQKRRPRLNPVNWMGTKQNSYALGSNTKKPLRPVALWYFKVITFLPFKNKTCQLMPTAFICVFWCKNLRLSWLKSWNSS